MPDTVASPLTKEQIAGPRDATRDAIASARIKGTAVSAAARSLMDLHDAGRIDDADLIAAVRQ